MKRYAGMLFLLWTGGIIVAYYVVQKPGLLNALTGLVGTVWTLVVAVILLFNAYGMGRRILNWVSPDLQDSIDHSLLGWGIGLGCLGLLGLFFSAAQLANEAVLTIFQVILAAFFLLKHDLTKLRADLHALASQLNLSFSQYPFLTRFAIGFSVLLSFLLTLVPPFEAFDALLYHLAQPARILQDNGLRAIDIAPHFWFPNLTENVYLWALGMGSERAAQIIHFTWAMLAAFLLWYWSTKTWNAEISRKTLLLLAAMPALPMLASWAYADMALVYYSIAALYAFISFRVKNTVHWLVITAIMSGFAMGVKYTSFVLPLACGLLLLFNRPLKESISNAAQFSAIAIITALPYYARNAILMGNPFYPFVFGGRFWDDFQTAWYADSATGIGWNVLQLLLLPINILLGHHDANFFDGRMGPLFLILAPFTIWVLITRTRRESAEGWSLLAIGVFSLLSFAAWTIGIINSSALWQARLLLPALISFAIPTALAWDSLKAFDTSRLRISVLVNALIAIIILLTIFDNTLFVLQRNPLAVAIGAQSRERYIERVNPSYAALMTLMGGLPADAQVYSLFEPRSYGLPRRTRPDPIVSNFAHDVHLHQSADAIIRYWKSEQYTHVIVYERGREFMVDSASGKFTSAIQIILQETLGQLEPIARTPDNVYSLYEIP